ncbi:hypothetical protein MLD38_002846 [Melastoma candidum]|uniref:Uncharacterized protein n=1 Tax=Melastoma candidum TaxID=119954 RepID=A0ACB9S0T3_9MYRT|nr:hypothetical protein MLD38_002846 [Melastoma candidum]
MKAHTSIPRPVETAAILGRPVPSFEFFCNDGSAVPFFRLGCSLQFPCCVSNSAGFSGSVNGSRWPLGLGSSFRGAKLTVDRPRPVRSFVGKRQSAVATAVFSLPTAGGLGRNPERASPEKLPKWSAGAIKSFGMAELEARKLKYPNTGTETLIMGILVEGTSLAANPEHPPLTEPAQRALDWAIDTKLKSGEDGEITPSHILLGIWSEESAGHKILESMGFTDEKAEELAKSMDKDVKLRYK